jgi:outer membrane lipoprotein-sorting protein
VTPPSGISWTHADGDYAILINGEKMTVTNVSGNTLTVTRAVNGVSKTHANGSAVTLADPCYYGL